MFRFRGEGGGHSPFIFVVGDAITTIFCTAMDHENVSLNMKKLHKINQFIDNDVIMLRHLPFVKKYTKQNKRKIQLIPF